jgi:hypothetical protein
MTQIGFVIWHLEFLGVIYNRVILSPSLSVILKAHLAFCVILKVSFAAVILSAAKNLTEIRINSTKNLSFS